MSVQKVLAALAILSCTLFAGGSASAAILAQYNFDDSSAASEDGDANSTATDFFDSDGSLDLPGIGNPNPPSAYRTYGDMPTLPTTGVASTGPYFGFTIVANSSLYKLNLTSLEFN